MNVLRGGNRSVKLTEHQQSVRGYREHRRDGVSLWWLGQAGFLIQTATLTILIDAYLSDSLAEKYRGKKHPHRRMMAAPVLPADLSEIDYCLSTHGHSDHLDPGLIPILAEQNPQCRFVIPEAIVPTGIRRGIPENRIIALNAGLEVRPTEEFRIRALPAAHESLEKNEKGQNLFLGYMMFLGEITVYHPGDCVPFPELDSFLSGANIDLALMPVNGRSKELNQDGIAGNFTLKEAMGFVGRNSIPRMIAHHYGMFDFNTVDPDEMKHGIQAAGMASRVFPAETGVRYHLTAG